MRVLFAATGFFGHYTPLVPVIDAVARRGDELVVLVPPSIEASVAEAGYPYRLGGEPPADAVLAIRERLVTAPAAEAAIFGNRELFGRLCTAAMAPYAQAVFDEWQPDLLLREPTEFASAITAMRRGVPHAQVAIGLAEVEAGALELTAPALEPYGAGIPERLLATPYLARFPASLDPSGYARTRRFREAEAIDEIQPLPDWWAGAKKPLVYVSFGSIAGGLVSTAQVYRAALDAVAGLDVRVLLTLGRGGDWRRLGEIPPNVHVERWVAQARVLREASLVVSHGGAGTTFGALAAGLPVVVVPLFSDQFHNAKAVARTGAGIVVEPDRRDGGRTVDAGRLEAAIRRALVDVSQATAANRIRKEMGATPLIADALESLYAELQVNCRS
jgi:UDP:flavonoid glycosyltransferase YjiC (YdhE family)